MKLTLVLVALLQRALCSQQAMDPAELRLALQSKHLDAWIEGIAVSRQIPKDVVRSNIQATTYHLDPVAKHPGSATDGERATLERRQPEPEGRDYPEVYGFEVRNDRMTNNRLLTYHILCRRALLDPPGSPYTPNSEVHSFWRTTGGDCAKGENGEIEVAIFCRLPTFFGPPGWSQNALEHIYETRLRCQPEYKCTLFKAHNFLQEPKVTWAGCTQDEQAVKAGTVNNVPEYAGKIPCPIRPGKSGVWDVYGQTKDGGNVDWTFFSGREKEKLSFSRSPTFMMTKFVQWRGKDPDYEPWLKFARLGERPTIELYSHVL